MSLPPEAIAPQEPLRRCEGVNQDGSACKVPPSMVLDDGKCISHSRKHRLAKLQAVTAGGLAHAAPKGDPTAPTPTFRAAGEVLSHFEVVAGEHRRGNLTDGQAFAQCSAASKAWEVLAGDRRLRILERDPGVSGVEVVIDPASGQVIVRNVVRRAQELPGRRVAELPAADDVIDAESGPSA
jgi:hypothetical protein